VKVLFIGEGRHDVGDPNPNPYHPRAAQGTIPTLTRRICPAIASDSLALAWAEIHRFNPDARKRGFPAKLVAGVLVSTRKFGCTGTIVVADRDGQPKRQAELQAGAERAMELFRGHTVAWGLAVESVEAWTLGAPEKIAEELGVDVKLVVQQYPRRVHVESLSERSGKEEHRPERLLERIAQLKHREDCTELRQAVAERTDVAALAQACPQGFAPFCRSLRAAFRLSQDTR
jgi:hypothetical protein